MGSILKNYADLKQRCRTLSDQLCARIASYNLALAVRREKRPAGLELIEPRLLMSGAPLADVYPGAQTTTENVALTFSSGNNNQLEASAFSAAVSLSVPNGTLTLPTTSDLTFINGTTNGSDALDFGGSPSAMNAALNGLLLTPSNGFVGSDPLTFKTATSLLDLFSLFTTNTVPLTVNPAPPTVATAAAASPATVTGTSTLLSVLGANDNGPASLTYTWATIGTPPAPVTFSANGTNAASDTTATFTKAGTYDFQVTITNTYSLSVTSDISVLVDQTLTTLSIAPSTSSLNENQTQQFAATGYDQFGRTMAVQPTVTWSNTGVGSITTGGLYTSPGGTGSADAIATSGSVSVSALITVTNAPPTVATAAAANPSTVTGTSTSFSVLGADDGGESNLTYSWSILSAPVGASGPSFSLNGSNAAKNTTATFQQAGSYELAATITDAGGLSVTSDVTIQVNQTLTSIVVTPADTSLEGGASEQFAAQALDQFGQPMTVQPSFNWSANAGSITALGLFTAPASGSATISAANSGVTGSTTATAVPIGSAVASPSPVTGNSTTLSVVGGLTVGVTYDWTVLSVPTGAAAPLFSDNNDSSAQTTTATFSAAGAYSFQVAINDGTVTTQDVSVTVDQTLTTITVSPATANLNENQQTSFSAEGFDQFGAAMATQPSFSWFVSSGGGFIDQSGLYHSPGYASTGPLTITAQSDSVQGTATVNVTNAAPTVAQATAALPSTVTGNTTTLTVLGADDGGESNLTYNWSVNGPGSVTFSSNNTNAAQSTQATFTQAGSYDFTATITDAGGLSVTSSTTVTVAQTLTTLAVSPTSPTVAENTQQQFTATAFDQFGDPIASPALNWSVSSGGGSIDSSGLFTAPATFGDSTVSVTSSGVTANATVTIPNEPPTVAQAAAAQTNPVTGISTTLSVLGADDGGESNLTYTWSLTGSPPAAVTFSINGANAAKSTLATFASAGAYDFSVTITDAGGLSTTSSVTVTVQQTLTGLTITPTTATVDENTQQQFTAGGIDQFGNAMAVSSPTWSVTQGGGSIDSTGLYTAPATFGTATIQATLNGLTATASTTIPDEPPTVAIAAAALPNPINATTTALSVLGADDGGESNLTYTWSATGPAGVNFSVNGSNAAANTTATFSAAGTYDLLVTITDQQGLSTTSAVDATVNQTLTSLAVTRPTASVGRGQSLQFTVSTLDQFGQPMQTSPAIDWSILSGQGAITSAGLYTAPDSAAGTVTVSATANGITNTASFTLTDELQATVHGTQYTAPNTPFLFSDGTPITISDADSETASVPATVTLTATNGTLSLFQTAGLTFSSGNPLSDTSVTFTGPISDIDKALRDLTFTPTPGFKGLAGVTATLNETGAANSPTYTVPIEVQSLSTNNQSGGITSPTGGSGGSTTNNSGILSGGTTSSTSSGGSSSNTGGSTNSTVIEPITIPADTDSSGGTNIPVVPVQPPIAVIATSGDTSIAPPTESNAPSKSPIDATKPPEQKPTGNAAANNPTSPSPAGIPDAAVNTVPDQVFPFLSPQSQMSRAIDQMNQDVSTKPQAALRIAAGSATFVSLSASAAYLFWLLRGGSLLSSMLSFLPAWKSIDPLPVLDNFESRKRRKERMATDLESLESLIDDSAAVPLNPPKHPTQTQPDGAQAGAEIK